MNEWPCDDTIYMDADHPLVQATYRCNRGFVDHTVHCDTRTLADGTEVVVHWFTPAETPVTP